VVGVAAVVTVEVGTGIVLVVVDRWLSLLIFKGSGLPNNNDKTATGVNTTTVST